MASSNYHWFTAISTTAVGGGEEKVIGRQDGDTDDRMQTSGNNEYKYFFKWRHYRLIWIQALQEPPGLNQQNKISFNEIYKITQVVTLI